MRNVNGTITRNLATIPEGFDFEGTTREEVKRKGRKADASADGKIPASVTETFVTIPAPFGVFEGAESEDELNAIAVKLFGSEVGKETMKDDDDEPVFPKGTPMTWPVACTLAFKLAYQKSAFGDRTPEGTGRLTTEQVMAITKWYLSDPARKPIYSAKVNEFLAIGNFDAIKTWLVKEWIGAGRPEVS